MLTWQEAREHLKNGMAIRRACWRYNTRWKLVDGKLRQFVSDTSHHYCYPRERETSAIDWMVYE